jgi:hypothetical protein
MTLSQFPSVIGNMADLHDGEVALPRFMVKRDDGLFVDLSRLESVQDLQAAVDRIFSADAYFLDLDYPRFLKLLFSADPSEACNEGNSGAPLSLIRFAADIVAFRPERRALYKAIKMGNGEAEYYFETVYLERTERGASGELKTVQEPATLTFDEFVADMWQKGIRFGIDAAAVREAISSGKGGRIVIARRQEAVLGKAADIQELAKEIHRDNAPARLPDGRVNLGQFQNRFPQINKGVRLLKKIPLVMGTLGHELSGAPVEPPIPKDFNLAALAGPGTAVETSDEGEFIVSLQDGFLNMDTQSNQISITEKIINREGVSAKTTGNLILTGDEYEEHGEVQEKRLVEGNNILMHADVFGTVSSRGGRIVLKRNLVGGAALNREGDITVEGVASGATLQTHKGVVYLKKADNCVITADAVVIESASNCYILADEINIATAEGCAIVGKAITLTNAGPRKQSEMLIFVPVPDVAEIDRKIAAISEKVEAIETAAKKKTQAMEAAMAQDDVRKYVMLAGKVKKGELTLTPEQQGSLQKMAAAVSSTLKQVSRLSAEIKEATDEKTELATQAATLEQARKAAEGKAFCRIANITGDILLRTLKVTPGKEDALQELPPQNIKSTLRGTAIDGERIPVPHGGALNWTFGVP